MIVSFVATGTTILARRRATAERPTPAPPIAAAQDTKSIFEGSKAGDRKELVRGIAFRWCPAGKFKMGEGDDTIDVELSRGFWLGETEVAQDQWQKLMGTSPWTKGRVKGLDGRRLDIKEGPDYAASYISYDDARSFCEKLTTQEQRAGRLPKSWKYSLPTEAQWEYACRAGTTTKYSFCDDASQLSHYAWFRGGPNRVRAECAYQVGLKQPNAWGFRDMHGNVWEWCSDLYESRFRGVKARLGPPTLPPPAPPPPLPDGTPGPPDATSAKNRVIRGGSWIEPPLGCTSANRFYLYCFCYSCCLTRNGGK